MKPEHEHTLVNAVLFLLINQKSSDAKEHFMKRLLDVSRAIALNDAREKPVRSSHVTAMPITAQELSDVFWGSARITPHASAMDCWGAVAEYVNRRMGVKSADPFDHTTAHQQDHDAATRG